MKFELRPHQHRGIDGAREAVGAGSRRIVLQLPTGAGKTVIAARLIEGALAKGKRVLFTVPFLSLVDQTADAFREQGITSFGIIQADHPATDPDQPVQIASIQTLSRRPLPPAHLVINDEIHRWFEFYEGWMARPEWSRVPFIGLSATPWTKGLGKHFEKLIVPTTTGELIQQGLLSPFRVFAPAHPDLSKVKTVAGDYHVGGLSKVMSEPVLIADTVSTWLQLGENRPTLCFAVDRAHARRLANEFEAAGVPTGYVDMNTPPDERRLIGDRLRQGQIKVVCNVFTLTTGVDWDVRCIILARPTKSEILYTQIIGRGLRTAEGKDDCLILDHSDSTLRLGFVTDIHHEHLDMGKHQKSDGERQEKKPPTPKECSACHYLKPAGVHACPECGFAPERQSLIEDKEGTLVALNGRRTSKQKATHKDKQDFWSMLMWCEIYEGRTRPYSLAKYKQKFGAWPRSMHDNPTEPDTLFRNWLKSSFIAWKKSEEKKRREASHAA